MQYLRRLPRLEYLEPTTLAEACTLLSRYDGRARVIAGGTDLLPKMKRREIVPECLVGLSGIPGLDSVTYTEGNLRLGTMATLASVAASPVVRDRFSVLHQAIRNMASAQVRNLGTVAGNLCNASPSADSAAALMALGASLTLRTAQEERTIPVESFFIGPSETVLKPGEILAGIQVPQPLPHSAGVYIKHTVRRAMDLGIVGVAVSIAVEDGICRDIHIALGSVAPTPIRATRAEALLRGKSRDKQILSEVGKQAAAECQPITDLRASAEYRREMAEVLVQRAIDRAWSAAR